ncbi:phosphotransferase [Bacillus sp. FJAT-49736]|uniref:phosphotransferase n=1 Tax=Bacillus sp. FJAT-49736 TaxID=2833582 RepID=UPI001BC9C0F6|nr:phosphotransferase [Bacillus sp. FJAT-49736]
MKIAKKGNEGDGGQRLLRYLSQITGEKFIKITSIKDGVWLCHTDKKKWILKEFSSSSKLSAQIKLTELLLSNNFNHTYQFHPIHLEKHIKINQKIYGLIEYLENNTDGKKFTYQRHEHQNMALQLLKKFHEVTGKFTNELDKDLHEFNQIKKWKHRLNEFKENKKYLSKWLPNKYYYSFIDWSEWSIEYMEKNKAYFLQKPHCIIHGDVAHHNFILSNKGLYLIDFDLAKIAPASIDDLQFCNRILPHLDWSLEKLFMHRELKVYKNDKAFLSALIFPTDLLREWNYFLKYEERRGLSSFLTEITFWEFKQREKFVEEVMKHIKYQ